MKNNRRTTNRTYTLYSIIAVICLTFFSGSRAQTPVDLGELEFGIPYRVEKETEATGFFTAPASGEMTISFLTGSAQNCLYTNENLTPGQLITGRFNNNFNAPGYVYEVTEGEIYFVKVIVGKSDGVRTFSLYMDGVATKPFEIAYMTPQTDGETLYNLAKYNEMFVRFSKNVEEVEDVELTYLTNGGDEKTLDIADNSRVDIDYLYIGIGDVLIPLLKEEGGEGIRPHAPFTVRTRVKDNADQYPVIADEEGWISYSYTCGFIPTTVTETSWPAEFLSYWPTGDESGIATITYSAPLATDPLPNVILMIGELEGAFGSGFWRSTFPARIEGNQVIVDLTGVRRSYDDILAGNSKYDTMTIEVAGIYDENNMPVVSNYSGNVATYVENLHFKNLPKEEIYSEWTPASGVHLADTSEIEVWINGLKNIRFNGFTFECERDGEVIYIRQGMEEITVTGETSDGNEAVFTLSVPEEARTASSVKVYPTDLVSLNGYDYEVNLTATYNTLVLTWVKPGQGSSIENLMGEEIEAQFNYADQYPDMFVTVWIKDSEAINQTEVVVMDEAPMTRTANIFRLEVTENIKLYLNQTYEAIFTVWASEEAYLSGEAPMGSATAIWYGASPGYINSPAILLSISPDESVPLNQTEGIFKLTFDSQVTIDTENSYYIPFMTDPVSYSEATPIGDDQSVSPADGLNYSTEWELTVGRGYIGSNYPAMTLVIIAYDTDGQRLSGNKGKGEDAYYEFTFKNTTGAGLTVADDEKYEVSTLSGIRVMTTDNIEALKTLAPGIYIINGKKVKL